ncbi:MerR family transcriptional regulator [Curtobacterium sp. A7_M15]|uniref:MerR family transcriptional regulator n=1 Tax=Curtobacterium sp. A7_M15 TaxID=3065241 RepID=UPI002738027F|nr:MerR family transcriptional regulator [Curtobacterium sp. A7_M15]MDP4334853.1 MerR family transcriptional regulator [Curtobacterium sp. A7_M15]
MVGTLNSDISVKVKRGAAMQIGELSRASGASARSLRYYEQLGFIRPERRANGYREYDASDVETVGTIRMLLDLGLPTALIEQVLPCTRGRKVEDQCPGIVDQVVAIRDDMDARAQRLLATRDALSESLSRVGR